MDWKIWFWHIFPSHRSLTQTWWTEKSFFSKVAPSPEGISQPRWSNRASGFHRLGNYLSMDGKKSPEGVPVSSGFHPHRNKSMSDGGFSQKCPDTLHPHRNKSMSDGGFSQKRPNTLHPYWSLLISDGRGSQAWCGKVPSLPVFWKIVSDKW